MTTLERGASAVTVWGLIRMLSMVLAFVKPCWVVDDGAEDEEQAEGEVEQE